jgi:transposase
VRTDTRHPSVARPLVYLRVVLSYEELLAQNRSLEALLRAEQDRARTEQGRREIAEEEKALALRQLEELRRSYGILQQEHELLRRRIFEAKAERLDPTQLEIEFEKTKAALDAMQKRLEAATAAASGTSEPPSPPDAASGKRKPNGRRRLDESALPTERIEIPDPAMELLVAAGEAQVVDADESSLLKHRRASMIRLIVAKKTYRLTKSPESGTETTLVTAETPPSIIERSIGTPSLYAHIATEKFDRSMPLYRQEERFGLAGTPIDRGTMSRWLEQLGGTLGPTILHAMRTEALATAMCLSTDATGILVQQGRDPTTKARRPCKKGHYFVQIADRDAVFFEYTEKETSAAVLAMFRGFSGYVQADAKNVFDILFREPDEPPDDGIEPDPSKRREVGCWAHTRRYFWEAAAVAKEPVAREALFRIRRLFEMDAKWKKDVPPQKRKLLREQYLGPEIVAFFAFVEVEYEKVRAQRGLLRSALGYAKNQMDALMRFLEDGRLRMDNNHSERALRKIAVGRKNWLFVGSDDHAASTANLLSMIASAKLHDLDPEQYLRDIFRVLPHWPDDRYLELAPKYWPTTRARLDPRQLDDEIGALTVPTAAAK